MKPKTARGGAGRPMSRVFAASILLAFAGTSFALPARGVRVVTVKAAVDHALGGEGTGPFRIARWLCGASRVLNDAFGLRFKLKRYATWTPPSVPRPLPDLMSEFLNQVGPEDAEIVIGVVSRDRSESRSPGVANYAHGAILVREMDSDRLMILVLVHELCHLFGAVDLNTRGSIMSKADIRLSVDAFTAKVVAVHRSRAFGRRVPLLLERDLKEAVRVYRERSALDLGEVELDLILANLCLECDAERIRPAENWVWEAVRCCKKALARRPDCAAARHLLGVALAREGDIERARASFEKAGDFLAGSSGRE